MSQLPRLSGWPAACVIIVIVLCVTSLELMALYKGFNGTVLIGVVGALLAFGGGLFGFTLKNILPK